MQQQYISRVLQNLNMFPIKRHICNVTMASSKILGTFFHHPHLNSKPKCFPTSATLTQQCHQSHESKKNKNKMSTHGIKPECHHHQAHDGRRICVTQQYAMRKLAPSGPITRNITTLKITL